MILWVEDLELMVKMGVFLNVDSNCFFEELCNRTRSRKHDWFFVIDAMMLF